MPSAVSAGDLDRCYPCVVRECRGAGEAAGAADSAEQPAGDHRTDAVHIGQAAAGLSDDRDDLLGQSLQSLVSIADLGDQVASELHAAHLDRPGRSGPRQRLSCGSSRQVCSSTARKQITQQCVVAG